MLLWVGEEVQGVLWEVSMSEEILVGRINVLQRQIDTLSAVVSNLEARLDAIASAAAHPGTRPASSVACESCGGCGLVWRKERTICPGCNGKG